MMTVVTYWERMALWHVPRSSSINRYKPSGKSAGYGFVEMGSEEQALRAVVTLDGVRVQGHCLRLFVMPQFSLRSKPLSPQPKESPS